MSVENAMEPIRDRVVELCGEQKRAFDSTLERMGRNAPAQHFAFKAVHLSDAPPVTTEDWMDLAREMPSYRGTGDRSEMSMVKGLMNAARRGREFMRREAPFLYGQPADDVGY